MLADLGLCKWLAQGEKASAHVGTQGYMAPEILHGDGSKGQGYGYPADL